MFRSHFFTKPYQQPLFNQYEQAIDLDLTKLIKYSPKDLSYPHSNCENVIL